MLPRDDETIGPKSARMPCRLRKSSWQCDLWQEPVLGGQSVDRHFLVSTGKNNNNKSRTHGRHEVPIESQHPDDLSSRCPGEVLELREFREISGI